MRNWQSDGTGLNYRGGQEASQAARGSRGGSRAALASPLGCFFWERSEGRDFFLNIFSVCCQNFRSLDKYSINQWVKGVLFESGMRKSRGALKMARMESTVSRTEFF